MGCFCSSLNLGDCNSNRSSVISDVFQQEEGGIKILEQKFNNTTFKLMRGHFSKLSTTCIVNCCDYKMININSNIVQRAGLKFVQKELKYLLVNNPVEVGKTFRTHAGKLKRFQYIYHSYLPPWQGNLQIQKPLIYLHFSSVIQEGDKFGVKSILFVLQQYYDLLGYPRDVLGIIIIDVIKNQIKSLKNIQTIIFVDKDEITINFFKEIVQISNKI